MDFQKDLYEILIRKYNEFEIAPPNGDLGVLIKGYININDKLIDTKRRTVKISRELKEKDLGEHFNKCLKQIKNKFKNGKNINPYLSKFAQKPNKRDLLLYDWGIHHLHLNNELNSEGYVERSDYLLFFMIDSENVYFIDVSEHKLPDRTEFSQQNLLLIVKRNWPNLLEKYKLNSEFTLAKSYTDKEISEIRKNGGMVLTEIDGDFYGLIGGGITTARTNIQHTKKCDAVFSILGKMTEQMLTNKTNLFDNPYINEKIFIEPKFKLVQEEDTFFVINEFTRIKIMESKDLYNIIFK